MALMKDTNKSKSDHPELERLFNDFGLDIDNLLSDSNNKKNDKNIEKNTK